MQKIFYGQNKFIKTEIHKGCSSQLQVPGKNPESPDHPGFHQTLIG